MKIKMTMDSVQGLELTLEEAEDLYKELKEHFDKEGEDPFKPLEKILKELPIKEDCDPILPTNPWIYKEWPDVKYYKFPYYTLNDYKITCE